MILTPEEGRKLHVHTLLEGKRIGVGQAAEALGLSPRQVRRLRVTLRREGPAGLVHGNRGHRSARRLPDALRSQMVALARGRYAGLNDHHLTEKLTAVEGLAALWPAPSAPGPARPPIPGGPPPAVGREPLRLFRPHAAPVQPPGGD